MDARAVAELIRLEHPQIIAIVLAYLEPDQSAEVLSQLPANMRSDIMVRIATLDGVQPSALNELDDIMEKTFAARAPPARPRWAARKRRPTSSTISSPARKA